MKFVVATYGTEGDARPFAALCRGLMDAGHEARLLADGATLGSAQALGVPTTALAGDIRSTLGPDHAIASVVAKGGGFNTTARALAKIANENAESWLRTIKTLPDNFLPIGDTPHDWLLPRCGAVIHHGGSGTSHSAARSGVPSIAVPFAGDQFFWAERLRQAGIAPAAVDGRRPYG
jgi:UDP:flavonoid glycosyltransferase YjiC (YdhE family)